MLNPDQLEFLLALQSVRNKSVKENDTKLNIDEFSVTEDKVKSTSFELDARYSEFFIGKGNCPKHANYSSEMESQYDVSRELSRERDEGYYMGKEDVKIKSASKKSKSSPRKSASATRRSKSSPPKSATRRSKSSPKSVTNIHTSSPKTDNINMYSSSKTKKSKSKSSTSLMRNTETPRKSSSRKGTQ